MLESIHFPEDHLASMYGINYKPTVHMLVLVVVLIMFTNRIDQYLVTLRIGAGYT